MHSRMHSTASVEIQYVRSSFLLDVSAVVGRFHFVVDGIDGISQHLNTYDFMILADALAPLGSHPQEGDIIYYDGQEYQVLMIPGEPSWRWSDEFHTTYRIHTKQIT